MGKDFEYNVLLSRKDFKNLGLLRFNGMCCFPECSEQAVDAHHIMDRKLWKNGGYYLSNCAPVCEKHHIECEKGRYTPYEVMQFAKIDIKYLQKPDLIDWMDDDEYKQVFTSGLIDKWGK